MYLAQVDYDRIYLRDDDGNHFEAAIAEPSLLRMVIDDALLCSKDTVFPENSEPLLGHLILIIIGTLSDYLDRLRVLDWSLVPAAGQRRPIPGFQVVSVHGR